jgi:NADH:ubiquinone oxidoreductase subunit 3 (subunit A)
MNGLEQLIVCACITFGLLLTPSIFSLMDFRSGIRKAKERGEKITSDGWKRTTKKLTQYYNMLLALVVVDMMQIVCLWYLNTYQGYGLPLFPAMTLIGSLVVALIEIKSIREKADEKVKKQSADVATLVTAITSHAGDPVAIAKAVVEYMRENEVEKKQ